MVNEQTHHAEPNDGNTRWENNKRGKGPLPVNKDSNSECKDGCKNGRRGRQELRITRRIAHSFHQNNGEEVSKCIAGGGRTAEDEGEAPVVDVADVAPEFFSGEVVVLGVGAISFDAIEHPFGLLLGEECILVWKTLDNYKGCQEKLNRDKRTYSRRQ